MIEILVEARVLYRTVIDLPILPQLATKIEEEVIIKSIFSTAAIEGNPLREEEVAKVLSRSESEETGKLERAKKKIRNLKNAYDTIGGLERTTQPFTLTEEFIKQIHLSLTKGIKHKYNILGQYRNHIVYVGNEEHGGIYRLPKILEDIQNLMKEFIGWINNKEVITLNPVIRAALAHYHLGLIHPFADGNGRTARIIEALLLGLAGIKYIPPMLSNFYYRNLDDYYWAFSKSIKNKDKDITPFLGFVFRGFIDSLNEIKRKITFYIRKFTLRDYYAYLRAEKALTQRQHDFLVMLLDDLRPLTLENLFNTSPFKVLYRGVSRRTATRNLEELCDRKLLVVENGKYELNFGVLG